MLKSKVCNLLKHFTFITTIGLIISIMCILTTVLHKKIYVDNTMHSIHSSLNFLTGRNLRSQDGTSNFNHSVYNFTYISPRISVNRSHLWLIFVVSDTQHFNRRTSVRQTWAHQQLQESNSFKVYFIVGESRNATTEILVKQEADHYGDILKIGIVDDYRNLTYKSIAVILWTLRHAPDVKFLVKTDDDVVVNTFALSYYMNYFVAGEENRHCIFCRVVKGEVSRNESKWAVSVEEFPDDVYPRRCIGMAYIIPVNLLEKLADAMLVSKFLWLEDIFVTVVLARKAKINIVDLTEFFSLSESDRYFIKKEKLFIHVWPEGGIYNGSVVERLKRRWKRIIWRSLT